jgi:transcriptional regulator with XRE-family HTH domain
MDPAHLLRTARRHLGLSQRGLADALGVPSGSLASWESGRRQPAAAVLDRALRRVGLELSLVAGTPPDDDAELIAHLRRPVAARLHELAGVELLDPVASALWVPGPASRVRVRAHRPRRPLPATPTVVVEASSLALPPYALPITLDRGRQVWVAPPGELALRQASRLRAADALLHDERGRDDAGRRGPAHRDPDERAERYRVLQTVGSRPFAPAARATGRGWRLAAPVSLAQLLREGGTLPA